MKEIEYEASSSSAIGIIVGESRESYEVHEVRIYTQLGRNVALFKVVFAPAVVEIPGCRKKLRKTDKQPIYVFTTFSV